VGSRVGGGHGIGFAAAHIAVRLLRVVTVLAVAIGIAGGFSAQTSGARIVRAATAAQGGINVEPAARPWRYVGANPEGWWCPDASTCTTSDPLARINTEMTLAKQLNVANVRLEIPWFLVEPSKGGYDWTRADYIFNSASSHGIVIQPILVYTPAWDGGYNAFPVAADFQAFVTTFMGRYGSRINAVEMWNEPDGGQSLNANNPALYVQDILIPGYKAVKAVNPSVRVIEGGSINDSGTCCAWLSGVINAGGGSYFDIAAFHDYGGNYGQVVSAYRSLVGGKPIWMGEYGVSDSTGSQQSSLIQAALNGTPGLAMAQFYTLRDESVYLCCPPSPYGEHKLYGVLTSNYSPKSSFNTMQSLLGGSAPPPPPPPPPASPSPTPSPSAAPSPTPSPSPSPSPSHGASQSPRSGSSGGSGRTPGHNDPLGNAFGGSSPASQATRGATAIVGALVGSNTSGLSASIRILSLGLLLVGLVSIGWGATRSTNIAALAGPKPKPPLFKPRSQLNVGLAIGGFVACAIAIVLFTVLATR
jgi:putative glycosyl hydrolase